MCVRVCLHCSHSDDSDHRACLSVGVWFPRLASSTRPCQFSFSGLFVACVRLDLLCNAYERFKGTGGLRREWSTAGAGRKCEARWENPRGWISSQRPSFRDKLEYRRVNKGHRESWRTVVVTPTVCPARAEPHGLLNHSGVTSAAAAAKATSRLKATWPSLFGKESRSWCLNSPRRKEEAAVALRFNPFLQVPPRVSKVPMLQNDQEPTAHY